MAEGIGSLGELGIGSEATAGTPVRAQEFLDFTDETLTIDSPPIESMSLRARRSRERAVPNRLNTNGSFTTELQSENMMRLWRSLLGNSAPSIGASPYGTTWKVLNTAASVTPSTVSLILGSGGTYWQLFYGACVGSVELRFALDQIVQAIWTVMARETAIDNGTLALRDAGAGYDANEPMVFTRADIYLNGSLSSDVRAGTIRINNGLIPKNVIKRQRAMPAHLQQSFTVEGDLEMYFSTDAELRRFLGDSGSSYPYKHVETAVRVGDLLINVAAASGSTQDCLIFDADRVIYRAVGAPVRGLDAIVQTVGFFCQYDSTMASPFALTLTNGQTSTNAQLAGTSVTSLP